MPKTYIPGKQEERRKKANYAGSITFKLQELNQDAYNRFIEHDEIVLTTETNALDIGFSLSVTASTGIVKTYTGKVYAQYADMKDNGMSLAVEGCSTPWQARNAVLFLMNLYKYRIDKIPTDDVEF